MSYLFFILASGWHVILLFTSTIIDWLVSKKIYAEKDKKKSKNWLYLSLFTNFGLLAIFKYLDFIINSLNLLSLKFWWAPNMDPYGIILPVGISFYTFQTVSYSIDIYREKYEPYKSFLDFATYASFFPQLVAGPIVRADDFKKQIDDSFLSFNSKYLRIGISMIIFGLAKKLVIADNVAAHVDFIFIEGQNLQNSALIWWGTICFGIQIYCDFSAYSDIAIGSALIFGIKLPENFNSPYLSRTPQEFWRRWHITLSSWLRDYLYIPLGGSRNGKNRMFFALMITMLLGGLWHGASWNFVIWGLAHGLLLLIHRLLASFNIVKVLFELTWTRHFMIILSWFTTQSLIFFTWLIFRIEDFSMLGDSMLTFVGWEAYFDWDEAKKLLPEIHYLTIYFVILFSLFHFLPVITGKRNRDLYANSHPIIWGIITGIFFLSMLFLRPASSPEFIYFRF